MAKAPKAVKGRSGYIRLIEDIFLSHYEKGARQVAFEREDIERAATKLGIPLPKNLGDVVYSFRYRKDLPESVSSKAPRGLTWIIQPAGRARYRFLATALANIDPNPSLAETKVPDSTPGVIEKYALSDEQALLAKLRYNRLVDIFTGVTCYSLQNHLRTSVPDIGQLETDELYVGLDRKGAHYVFPLQAKAGKDRLSVVQIEQDMAMCADKFPALICKPLAAQFMKDELIALFELERDSSGAVRVSYEKHYRLVPADQLTDDDLQTYRERRR